MNINSTIDEALIKRGKPVNFLLLALTPLLLGPILGVVTNFINADVSKDYFEIVMGWNLEYVSISTLAMLQGAIEGAVYGAVFGLVFTIFVVRGNYGGLRNEFFRRTFVWVVVIVLVCWLLGGILGVMLSQQFPELAYHFVIDSLSFGYTYKLERYCWVAGSIWGGMIGGLLALVWAIWKTSRAGAGSIAP